MWAAVRRSTCYLQTEWTSCTIDSVYETTERVPPGTRAHNNIPHLGRGSDGHGPGSSRTEGFPLPAWSQNEAEVTTDVPPPPPPRTPTMCRRSVSTGSKESFCIREWMSAVHTTRYERSHVHAEARMSHCWKIMFPLKSCSHFERISDILSKIY